MAPLLRLLVAFTAPLGSRSISGKVMRATEKWPPRPKPFPWETTRYTVLRRMFDHTSSRFNANTKVIVVEGPPAAGKTALAAQLAEEFDMRHFPEATVDSFYIDPYGFDMRSLDDKMPLDCRTFDHKDFCKDPNHVNVANFQILTYRERYSQYFDACTHLLNTGQGVVLERSPWSDFVFADAMTEKGYMSKAARHVYKLVRDNTIEELRHPHLVIYLDVPVSETQARIKRRALPYEQNSKVFTNEYLDSINRTYKEKYLKYIKRYSEVLVYDWSTPGDLEAVVEDVEKIDFDNYWVYDDVCKDWRFFAEHEVADLRADMTNFKPMIMNLFNVPNFDAPELVVSAEDCITRDQILAECPTKKFAVGYNTEAGDKGVLFKISGKQHIREGF